MLCLKLLTTNLLKLDQSIVAQALMSQYFMYLMRGVMVPMVIGLRVIEVGIAPEAYRMGDSCFVWQTLRNAGIEK
ncbi:MAG: hypothetical protein Q4A84_00825 [Neisseria sp.]|uniref:hypothetical protein n=1 Tax=Neisseria sp. TaxID=192066 RepID=UPI0026DBE44E|nr:hypothetical protein [Neisseria sp.]MDO4640237.1 hypothetical protein [Neisseria sp.]